MKQFLYGVIFLLVLSGCSSDSTSSISNPVIIDENTIDDNTTDDNTTDDNMTDDNITFTDAILHNLSFTTDHFSGSQKCADCHDGILDSTGKDVSIVHSWQSSMMANAAIDPLWRAKVASEVKRNPKFKDVIEEKCSRCHTPMADVEARFAGESISLFGDGFFNASNPHYDSAMNGVSCSLCHQIEDTAELGTDDGFSGQFIIAENFSTERKIYGQYTSPLTTPMRNNIEFTPVYSAHMDESELCATCHNLNTPVIDAEGNLNGSYFPEQAVYTEWQYSDFNASQSCQDCHMPKTNGSVIISTRGNNLQARLPFHQHQFIGANTYMLDIIKNNRRLLGALAGTDSFDETISNTKDLLLATADLKITATSYIDGKLNFTVLLTNHSGHKFPTSLPSRRAWIQAKITDSQGLTVYESGGFNSENGIIGVDETFGVYEPHYTQITDASQVQVYEAIMGDTDDELTYTFMNASKYLKDNRLLPKGYKLNTPANAQAYGEAVNDIDFIGGSDTIEYAIDNLASGEYIISVTLKYQTLSNGFAHDLFKDSELPSVALMQALDSNATLKYEIISSDTTSYTLP